MSDGDKIPIIIYWCRTCVDLFKLDFELWLGWWGVWRNVDTLHMNSIRVGLNSKEIVNGLESEFLLKMMNDIY